MTVDELAGHKHGVPYNIGGGTGAEYQGTSWQKSSANNRTYDCITNTTGKDTPHNNVQPCVAAYGWRRIS